MASSTQASLLEVVLKVIPEFLQPATFLDDGKKAFDDAFRIAAVNFPMERIDTLLGEMMERLRVSGDTMRSRCRFKIVVAIALCADMAAPVQFAEPDSFRDYVNVTDWRGVYGEDLSTYIDDSLQKLINSTIKKALIPYLRLEHPDKVTQASASAAGDSRGESSNTSVTADIDLSTKRQKVTLTDSLFEGHEVFYKNVESILRARRKVLAETPDSYRFCPKFQFPVADPFKVVNAGCFIDKTEMYFRVLNAERDVGLACFPRRFGKTTMLSFFSLVLGFNVGDEDRLQCLEQFYHTIHTYKKGHELLEQPVRPTLFFSWDDEQAGTLEQFKLAIEYGCPGLTVKNDVNVSLGRIVSALQSVFKNYIIPKLPNELKKMISSELCFLVDECQHPYSELEIAEFKGAQDKIARLSNVCDNINVWCRTVKWLITQGKCSRVLLCGILRLSGWGLSDLPLTDFSTFNEFQGLVGITSNELRNAMENAWTSDGMSISETEMIRRIANGTNLFTQPIDHAADVNIEEFYDLLKAKCNGFCFHLDFNRGDPVDLYSPIDVISHLQCGSSPDGQSLDAYVSWLQDCRGRFSVFALSICGTDSGLLMDSLAGGCVPISSIITRLTPRQYFQRGNRIALLRFYLEMGLLRVEYVIRSTESVVLAPTNVSKSPVERLATVMGEIPQNERLSLNQLQLLINDPPTLVHEIKQCAKAASESAIILFPIAYMREYTLQEILYWRLLRRFYGDFSKVEIEKTISNGRVDLLLELNKSVTVIIECKIATLDPSASRNPQQSLKIAQRRNLNAAYNQAMGYAENSSDFAGTIICIGVSWAWQHESVSVKLRTSSSMLPNGEINIGGYEDDSL